MNDSGTNDRNCIRLLAVGDVMLGDHPVCFGHGVRSTIGKYGFPFLFENVKDTQLDTDLLFGNLEAMFGPESSSAGLYDLEMKGKTEYAVELAEVGFNVMSVANNHALQHGVEAFTHTVNALSQSGIFPVGTKVNDGSNCFSYEKGGVKVAIVSYSMRPEKYCEGELLYATGNESIIIDHITELRNDFSHVIVSVHWGEEYIHYPSVEQVHLARKMIDSGASLILGHHPHVLQGFEEYNNGVIAYSLGNYIFDHWQRETRESIILDCKFGIDRIEHFEMMPILINRNYQPVKLHGKDAEALRNSISTYSEAIHSIAQVDDSNEQMQEYLDSASKAYNKYRLESYLYFLRNIHKYKISVLYDSMIRFLKRRINPDHP